MILHDHLSSFCIDGYLSLPLFSLLKYVTIVANPCNEWSSMLHHPSPKLNSDQDLKQETNVDMPKNLFREKHGKLPGCKRFLLYIYIFSFCFAWFRGLNIFSLNHVDCQKTVPNPVQLPTRHRALDAPLRIQVLCCQCHSTVAKAN